MIKLWRVAAYEYRRHVLQRRFVVAIVGMPLFIALLILITAVIVLARRDARPVGYVDQAGMLAQAAEGLDVVERADSAHIAGNAEGAAAAVVDATAASAAARPLPDDASAPRAFADVATARAALDAGTIQGYYVIPPDYRETTAVELVYVDDRPSDTARRAFEDRLRRAWLGDRPVAIVDRVTEGVSFVTPARDGETQSVWVSTLVNIGLPIFAGFVFITAIFTSAGYLMQAVVEEKENRTLEVLVTSVSPGKLIGGKIAGITAVGLTQIGVWSALGIAGLMVAQRYYPVLAAVRIEPRFAILWAATMLPAYVMIAALMTAVGATVAEASEAHQITGIFTLPVMLPYWFSSLIVTHPDSPLAVGLTLFPLTAPVAISLRAGATEIPGWQVAGYALLLTLSALGAIWLAGRAFRLGLLRIGQRVRWAEVFGLR